MEIRDVSKNDFTSVPRLIKSLEATGFQATELSRAIEVAREMRKDKECFKILAFTSNLVAAGTRGIVAELIRQGYADLVITAGGAIDHDVIKCFSPYGLGSFREDDEALRGKGINRLGNILVRDSHYALFEKFVKKVLDSEGKKGRNHFSPATLTAALSSALPPDRNSFLVAARERGVSVYSPAIIDSSLGLQLYFYKQDHPHLVLDQTGDFNSLATSILSAKRTGALVVGGGSSKHFTLGLNLLRGGLDYGVYLTTASEYDGSLSGALPKEAKSWGKIKGKAKTALVYGDATLTLPLLAAGLLEK
ncbi:deoxyhypusine synthase [Candidatus Micrarchaeota archaeon]|nr:deoxyhypusine synthase [Candidatus Micrarchaeota archaeon]